MEPEPYDIIMDNKATEEAEKAVNWHCAECKAEIIGLAGQVGRGKKAKILCLKHWREQRRKK